MATKKKAAVNSNLVRAKVTHIEPETQIYRTEGEVFERVGDPYKHVEPADEAPETDEDE
jgi:hypothetical protein